MGSAFGHQNLRVFSPTSSVAMQRAPLTRTERFAKRACDIAFTLVALVLLAPIMITTALAIKLSSVGPVFLREPRTGFDGRTIFILKFRIRSIRQDEVRTFRTQRSVVSMNGVGRLLRQSRIDELPQLFNVLTGDMSLVGPGPHFAGDELQRVAISSHAHKSHFRPGITGWRAVSRIAGEIPAMEGKERRIELDLWYINHWSIVLDFKIIWRMCFERL
jgi:lipopolysaccharide/colanic/teichoic acid biosynthesis glycosyltransferase